MTQGRLPAGRQAAAPPTARRRSEETLAALGLETALDTAARLEREGKATAARSLRRWVNTDPAAVLALLRMLPPPRGGTEGRPGRELRVGMCGVAFVAKRGGDVGFARRGCKDRLCPTCGERRRRRFSANLRAIAERREQGGAQLLFVTLTQPKVAGEPCEAAMDRLLESFRRFRECAWSRKHVLGGVRSLEVTARRVGARVGDYVVRTPGVHAHLHCVVEVAEGVLSADIAAAWGRSSRGSHVAGVNVQALTAENCYQVGNYVLDMSGMLDLVREAPEYARQVLAALAGRRLVASFGTWRGEELGLREDEGTLVFGDRSLYRLATDAPEDGGLVRWADGSADEADEVLRALLAAQDKSPL